MKYIWFVISWLVFIFLINLPLVILGWALIPIAALCKAYEPYQGHDGVGTPVTRYRFTWRFMWLWDNKIDGIADNTYSKYENMFMRIVSWSANRNPVSNLRFVKYLSFKIVPEKIKFFGSLSSFDGWLKFPGDADVFKTLTLGYGTKKPHWFLCWHGAYSCFYWRGKSREFLIGWKVYPKDFYGLSATSYRKDSTGFGLQFKKV